MHVIVDGYNVLFAIARYGRGRPVAEALDEARARLLPQLVRYAQHTGDRVTVVFDSRQPAGGASHRESVRGVRIIYSHPPRTADDDIRQIAEASSAPRHVRVVTSDRALRHACARAGADVVGAKTFHRRLCDLLRQADADRHEHQLKHEPPDADEVREFLELFGGDEPDD